MTIDCFAAQRRRRALAPGRFRMLLPLVASLAGWAQYAEAYPRIGKNGGQLSDIGRWHVEFIGGPAYSAIMFAISDAKQEPVGLADGSAYAVVVQQGQAFRLPLSKDGYNWLSATLDSPLSGDASVLVTAKLATGETVTARFVAK